MSSVVILLVSFSDIFGEYPSLEKMILVLFQQLPVIISILYWPKLSVNIVFLFSGSTITWSFTQSITLTFAIGWLVFASVTWPL